MVRVDFGEDGGRECPVDASLQLRIVFELDRDVIAGYWEVKFLVDSCDARIVKVLGETAVEDFPEGESDIFFTCPSIDLSGIPPSALTNSGLLIAAFMADGKEVAAVSCGEGGERRKRRRSRAQSLQRGQAVESTRTGSAGHRLPEGS